MNVLIWTIVAIVCGGFCSCPMLEDKQSVPEPSTTEKKAAKPIRKPKQAHPASTSYLSPPTPPCQNIEVTASALETCVKLTEPDRTVALLCLRYSNNLGDVFIGIEQIAEQMGIAKEEVEAAVERLKSMHFLLPSLRETNPLLRVMDSAFVAGYESDSMSVWDLPELPSRAACHQAARCYRKDPMEGEGFWLHYEKAEWKDSRGYDIRSNWKFLVYKWFQRQNTSWFNAPRKSQ